MAHTRRPALAPTNCSVRWDSFEAPAWGTAAQAQFWVALEQPGPWGRKAFTESRLDPQVGARLEKAVTAAGGRPLLIRSSREGVVDEANGYLRHVFVAGGMAQGTPWLLQGRHPDPAAVAQLPFEAIASGDVNAVREAAPWLWPTYEPVVLVCTNSKRDRCCALRGRPIVADLEHALGEQVWECTHTGGHRYAPTGILLPHGVTLGRIPDAESVRAALLGLSGQQPDAQNAAAAALARVTGSGPSVHGFARAVLPETLATDRHLRGLAHLSPAHQAADGHVRHAHGVTELMALTVHDTAVSAENTPEYTAEHTGEDTTDTHRVIVEHRDGRSWELRVEAHTTDALSVSCGAEPAPALTYRVTELG